MQDCGIIEILKMIGYYHIIILGLERIKCFVRKRLIHGISQYGHETTVHLLSDLEACYDRQIPKIGEIGEIGEELMGIDRKAIQLITKIVSLFKHFARTGFITSEESYGGKDKKLVATG